jgi:hypothetical protein
MPEFGNYLVFVDESGDHNLTSINEQYPVFVLLFCIVQKSEYVDSICPALQRFKFEYWGHDEVVLHEHEIRKPRDEFLILRDRELLGRFCVRLDALIEEAQITVVAVIIDKPALVARYTTPVSPYDYAMVAGLERVFQHLASIDERERITPVIVECRGAKEDRDLELAFRRACDGGNFLRCSMPFHLVMVAKSANSAGLQLADLMARPLGVRHLRPTQANRAADIIEGKLRRSPLGIVDGWGRKRLP